MATIVVPRMDKIEMDWSNNQENGISLRIHQFTDGGKVADQCIYIPLSLVDGFYTTIKDMYYEMLSKMGEDHDNLQKNS